MTDGYHQEWTERLSDYLAGELDEATRVRLEEHLTGCLRCREVLGELEAVVALARDAGDLQPPADLWPGIASSLAADERSGREGDETAVIALPTARERPVQVAISPARLAVAAAVLVLVSVATTWSVASAPPVAEAPSAVAGGSLDDGLTPVAGDSDIPADLAAQLGLLEELLASARPALDSVTVVVLERNLRTIETAIADSRRALAIDPGNAFLLEHLERMARRKLIYLQEAVRVAEWSG